MASGSQEGPAGGHRDNLCLEEPGSQGDHSSG